MKTFIHDNRRFALPVVFLLLLQYPVVAQITNQWTWVNGDSTVNKYGVYGTKGVEAPANKPGARGSYTGWTDAAHNFWMYGGFGHAASGAFGLLNDLWRYNHTTYQWTWMGGDSTINSRPVYGAKNTAASANWPGAREASCSWADANGNIWLFAGNGIANSGGSGYLNDLWKYNPAAGQWTWLSGDSLTYQHGVFGTKGSPAAANKPGSGDRGGWWMDATGNLWVFGGSCYATASSIPGNTNDLWKYDTTAKKWTWIAGDSVTQKNGVYGVKGTGAAANTPGVRIGSTCWTDNNHNLWLFGGGGLPASGGAAGYENDLWEFKMTTQRWIWVAGDSSLNNKYGKYGAITVASATNQPGSRYCSLSWIDANNNVWVYGGTGYAASGALGNLNDMWSYNIAANQWTWMRGDSVLNQYGVYGVKGSSSAPNKPGARGIASGWMDAAGNPWIFGGYGYSASAGVSYLNDLWGYQASASTLVLLPPGPPHVTATASGHHAVLLNWEQGNGGNYTIQRSGNNNNWHNIGAVAAGQYNYTDASPLDGVNYYRLLQTNGEGKPGYSNIAAVSFAPNRRLAWYASGYRQVQFVLQDGSSERYRISGIDGRLLQQGALQQGRAAGTNLPPGICLLQVITANGMITEKIFAQ